MIDTQSTSQLFSQALILMLVGMIFVFIFLSLLICSIKFIITPLGKKFPDHNNDDKTSSNTIPPKVVAAISAAINKHRQNSHNNNP